MKSVVRKIKTRPSLVSLRGITNSTIVLLGILQSAELSSIEISKQPLSEITVLDTASANEASVIPKNNLSVTKLVLIENDKRTELTIEGQCSVNESALTELLRHQYYWRQIQEQAPLSAISDLAILEQVKRQIQINRVMMAVNNSAHTQLIIHRNDDIQFLEAMSADSMLQSYPNANMLNTFMQVVKILRTITETCIADELSLESN